MNRTFYAFAIFFLSLLLVCGIVQSILYLKLDNQIFIQRSFANWFLVLTLIWLAGVLLQLRYYSEKKYKVAYITGIILMVSTLAQGTVLYVILMAGVLHNIYVFVAFAVVVATIVYALSLILSTARERLWLKAGGVFLLVVGFITIGSAVGMVTAQEVSARLSLQQLLKWATVGHSLSPLFFIVNFTDEIRRQKPIPIIDKKPTTIVNVLTLYALISTLFALIFGTMVSTQSASFLSWQKQNSEAARDVHSRHYEPRIFVNKNGDTTRYQFMRPLDYDSSKKYPLVLCLHHGGTHGSDNFSQLGADPAPYLESNRTKYPAFYLMPQCPKGFGWANIDGSIFAIIDELENEFPIDTSRRYVMGISGGGYGSWHFITARPAMFAAAIPICGGGNPELAGKITGVPVWAFHGEDDNLVPVRFSREMIESIKEAGGSPRYTEFPDAGHNIWNQVVATPGLMDWLFEQRRDSVPQQNLK